MALASKEDILSKLSFVSGVLKDVQHIHENKTHACTCHVCTKKEEFILSSLSQASEEMNKSISMLEEQSGITGKISGSRDAACRCERTGENQLANFNCSCYVVSGSVKTNGLDLRHRTDSSTKRENSLSDQACCAEMETETSIFSSTQRDSGMHTLLSTQSLSPIQDPSQEDVAKDAVRKNSGRSLTQESKGHGKSENPSSTFLTTEGESPQRDYFPSGIHMTSPSSNTQPLPYPTQLTATKQLQLPLLSDPASQTSTNHQYCGSPQHLQQYPFVAPWSLSYPLNQQPLFIGNGVWVHPLTYQVLFVSDTTPIRLPAPHPLRHTPPHCPPCSHARPSHPPPFPDSLSPFRFNVPCPHPTTVPSFDGSSMMFATQMPPSPLDLSVNLRLGSEYKSPNTNSSATPVTRRQASDFSSRRSSSVRGQDHEDGRKRLEEEPVMNVVENETVKIICDGSADVPGGTPCTVFSKSPCTSEAIGTSGVPSCDKEKVANEAETIDSTSMENCPETSNTSKSPRQNFDPTMAQESMSATHQGEDCSVVALIPARASSKCGARTEAGVDRQTEGGMQIPEIGTELESSSSARTRPLSKRKTAQPKLDDGSGVDQRMQGRNLQEVPHQWGSDRLKSDAITVGVEENKERSFELGGENEDSMWRPWEAIREILKHDTDDEEEESNEAVPEKKTNTSSHPQERKQIPATNKVQECSGIISQSTLDFAHDDKEHAGTVKVVEHDVVVTDSRKQGTRDIPSGMKSSNLKFSACEETQSQNTVRQIHECKNESPIGKMLKNNDEFMNRSKNCCSQQEQKDSSPIGHISLSQLSKSEILSSGSSHAERTPSYSDLINSKSVKSKLNTEEGIENKENHLVSSLFPLANVVSTSNKCDNGNMLSVPHEEEPSVKKGMNTASECWSPGDHPKASSPKQEFKGSANSLQWGAPAVWPSVKTDSDSSFLENEEKIMSGLSSLNICSPTKKRPRQPIKQQDIGLLSRSDAFLSTPPRNVVQKCLKEKLERSCSLDQYPASLNPCHAVQDANMSLPVVRCLELQNDKPLSSINESYEANQSFPKMRRGKMVVDKQHGETVGVQNVVTDLNQISTPLAPRSRRSIFGFSPPDPTCPRGQRSSKDSESGTSNLSSETDSEEHEHSDDLWSTFDVTASLGRCPSQEEVLFNCVTSSICVMDPRRGGKIISINEAFQTMVGIHEKVMGQRLLRFIKAQTDFANLGKSLPRNFVFADSSCSSLCGKLVTCVDSRGEETDVMMWMVPWSSSPHMMLCVLEAVVSLEEPVHLDHDGNFLSYSAILDNLLATSKKETMDEEAEEEFLKAHCVKFSPVEMLQYTQVESAEGQRISGTLSEVSYEKDASTLSAILRVTTSLVGLLAVRSDGLIVSNDETFFRLNFDQADLSNMRYVWEFLSDIIKSDPDSADSSQNTSPVSQPGRVYDKTACSLESTSQLREKNSEDEELPGNNNKELRLGARPTEELVLPLRCFWQQSDCEDSLEEDSDENTNKKLLSATQPCNENEDDRGARFNGLSRDNILSVPKTSTPLKEGLSLVAARNTSEIVSEKKDGQALKNGIYTASFLHGDGNHISIIFKVSKVDLLKGRSLFCLWVYIHPDPSSSTDSHIETDEEEEDDEGCNLDATENSGHDDDDEEEEEKSRHEFVRKRLEELSFNQNMDQTVDASLGQIILEQACLNQSHNAITEEEKLDLALAVQGSFSQTYSTLEPLGQGSFGFVRRAQRIDDNNVVVVKFIKKSAMLEESWMRKESQDHPTGLPLEVAILRELDSEHIIKVLDMHENASFFQMVMEDFGGVDLFDFIDQVSVDEPLACYLFRQIVSGVEYLHSHRVLHRDIKDENVLVSRKFQCKLIDFGSAAYMLPEGKRFNIFRGTREYCSPEVYQGNSYSGPAQEVWALGVTLYTLVFRENPYTDEEPFQLSGTDMPADISTELIELLLGLLQCKPEQRLTVTQALALDWMRQIVDMRLYSWEDMFGVEGGNADCEAVDEDQCKMTSAK